MVIDTEKAEAITRVFEMTHAGERPSKIVQVMHSEYSSLGDSKKTDSKQEKAAAGKPASKPAAKTKEARKAG